MSDEEATQEPSEAKEQKPKKDGADEGQKESGLIDEDEESRASPKKRTIIFAVGLLILVVGYLVLHQANPTGDNWAGKISPLLILGGYGTIFWSLWI